MQKKEYSLDLGGKTLTAQFTNLTDQTDGSLFLRLGNTIILATAVMSLKTQEGLGYFPLTVEFEERFYAAGKILGSRFMRREGRPTDEAVLSGRIVDRTIRPLFSQHIRNEVQIVVTVLSIDEDDPDILAVNAASLALATSPIPWNGPVSAVRIAKIKGRDGFIVNPTYPIREHEEIELDLVACGKDGDINMIEVSARQVPESLLEAALEKASEEIEKIQAFQKKIIAEIGKTKRIVEKPETPAQVSSLFAEHIEEKIDNALLSGAGKAEIYALKDTWMKVFADTIEGGEKTIANDLYEEKINERLHTLIIEQRKRPDGRGFDDIRELYAQAGGFSPVLHGSGIFFRGGTHIFSVLTLGGPQDSQLVENMEIQSKRRFMHHYNFPPYSVGETGRVGGFNRRMIGHGALAEKALMPVLPPQSEFPYTIRIVSETMASNGSSSMGSACASSLALMDAGVPIQTPVAGIASGLMMESKEKYALLTDIQGPEDEHGDMDFKVAGTRTGITAIQMDVKVNAVPLKILREALEKARRARLQILDVMEKEIAAPRPEISPYAPKILTMLIKPDQIGMVIGSGGKVINEIREKTSTEIEIEDDGTVYITGFGTGPGEAKKIIEGITKEYRRGERAEGVVVKIVDFGAFVRLGSNTEGLVHISEISGTRIASVRDVLKEGQIVPVVVKDIKDGKISLSIKEADPHFINR
ncbi:MAG: polyribonucleotide nucleotidyltransferase [Parcubacteria group bacterium Greene0714_4]|nr:MAG: polyribonucleotide nucleotidyltransferase [Parcubacteria group bacterium Greene0714_4]